MDRQKQSNTPCDPKRCKSISWAQCDVFCGEYGEAAAQLLVYINAEAIQSDTL